MQANGIYFVICQFGLFYLTNSATTFSGFENYITCIKIEKKTISDTVTVRKNSTLIVYWELKDNNWSSRKGKLYEEKINVIDGAVETFEFCFVNTSRDDSGIYYVWRDNDNNYTQQIAINVWYGPRELTVLPNVRKLLFLERNQTLTINCSADCNPACNISWRKGSDLNTTNSATLVLNNVSKNDSGYYTCLAENPRNNTYGLSEEFRVLVKYAARINLTPHRIKEIEENTNVNVTCSVESYPMSNISWFRGNKELSTIYGVENSHVLNLYNTTCDDTGTYTCSAFNDVEAEDSKDIKIDVLCKPRFLDNTFGNDIEKKEEVGIGDEIRMNISMQANPLPHIMSKKYDINANILNISGIFYHVVVRKEIVSELDFRQHYIIIGNSLGNVTITIDVKERKANLANSIEFIIGTPLSVLLLIGVIIIIITLVKRAKQLKVNQIPSDPAVNIDTGGYRDNILYQSIDTVSLQAEGYEFDIQDTWSDDENTFSIVYATSQVSVFNHPQNKCPEDNRARNIDTDENNTEEAQFYINSLDKKIKMSKNDKIEGRKPLPRPRKSKAQSKHTHKTSQTGNQTTSNFGNLVFLENRSECNTSQQEESGPHSFDSNSLDGKQEFNSFRDDFRRCVTYESNSVKSVRNRDGDRLALTDLCEGSKTSIDHGLKLNYSHADIEDIKNHKPRKHGNKPTTIYTEVYDLKEDSSDSTDNSQITDQSTECKYVSVDVNGESFLMFKSSSEGMFEDDSCQFHDYMNI